VKNQKNKSDYKSQYWEIIISIIKAI
jgi:hypothetical protein